MRAIATGTEISEPLNCFISKLVKAIKVEAIILFGSYINGSPGEWSDFDVAVISPDFNGMGMPERQSLLARLGLGCDTRISPIGYPSSEYRNPGRHSFLREIIRTGRVVWQAETNQPSMA